ncbi:radical SAM protein [Actinoplanes sp. TBRC 11911]|uniref:radical SAM protein n=1 Tax=Actinoplanes sp. TBRC 11911 TaxID=2729386 RepID=UPI00145D4BB0|nr:radical SAM protein [Actinoplanes sp. TBRC 11911]NMO54075.1 radical SAM protein [Actinoplanes sp. TBRC 11911]
MPATDSLPRAADNDPPLRGGRARAVRLRTERFGSIVYVPERDHFYALDREHTIALSRLGTGRPVPAYDRDLVVAMASAGICRTDPPTPQRAFYGRSLLGSFAGGIPPVRKPMVVNCFATAQCPLRCGYCHADDLMASYREEERPEWLDEVIRVAAATPAMVGVVTGGEPLARPDNAERLLTALARDKAVVLDTSGVGDLRRLVPTLRRHDAHVRFSLDSAQASVNDRLRPIHRRSLPPGSGSFRAATDGIRLAVSEGLACSVQTVVTARNCDPAGLAELRDRLLSAGVRTWALHVVVPAGKAARNARGLLVGDDAVTTLTGLVAETAAQRLPIDIRVTSTHRAPNSTVLISARGELAIQQPEGGGKEIAPVPRIMARRSVLRHFRRFVDPGGHASRYLNGTLDLYPAAGPGVTAVLPAAAAV